MSSMDSPAALEEVDQICYWCKYDTRGKPTTSHVCPRGFNTKGQPMQFECHLCRECGVWETEGFPHVCDHRILIATTLVLKRAMERTHA